MAMPPNVYGMQFMPIDEQVVNTHECCAPPAIDSRQWKAPLGAFPEPIDMGDLKCTWTGERVVMPKDPAILQLRFALAKGKRLDVHLHPYPRVAFVVSGKIRVVQLATQDQPAKTREFEAGDTIVETINRYHYGEVIGSEGAVLQVWDYLPPHLPRNKDTNTVYRDAKPISKEGAREPRQ